MLENLIVALIVGASAWYAASKYLPKPWRTRLGGASTGCGSGCGSCSSSNGSKQGQGCVEPDAAPPAPYRVIKIHAARG